MPTGKIYLGSTLISDPGAGGGSTPPLWTPADTTTALWLDASDATSITLTSGAVSQWNDKSGNGRHFSQGTAAKRPNVTSAEINGLDVVTFDGTNDYLTAVTTVSNWAWLNDADGVSMYFVIRHRHDNTAGIIIDSHGTSSGNRGASVFIDDRASVSRADVLANQIGDGITTLSISNITANNWIPASAVALVSIINDPDALPAAARSRVWKNSGNLSQTNASTDQHVDGDPAFVPRIGSLSNSENAFLNADFCEMVCRIGLDNEADRQRMEGYLANKWGRVSELPTEHLFKAAPPYKPAA
jgi:hypothetical protein